MKVLLDTHAALWWLAGDARFGPAAARAITDETNQVLLSAAVIWEVAIKRSLGTLDAPDRFAETLLAAGAVALPIRLEHAAAVEALEWHHRDPFGRLLVAQAGVENAALVTADAELAAHGVTVLW